MNDLKTILDHLGPNMFLHVDDVILDRLFGVSGDPLAAADDFAKPNCRFIRDQTGRGAGRFVCRSKDEPT